MKVKELILWVCAATLPRAVLAAGRFLWYDESYTGLLASQPLPALLAGTAADVHPPLYYLLVMPLAHLASLGAPEWIIRIPSILAGALSVYLAYKLGPALGFNSALSRALVIVTAIAPAQIWYGSEARQYALLTVLYMAAALAVTRRRWGWFTLGVIAMAYTHNYGLFYAASLALLGLNRNPRDIWRIARAAGLSAAAWLPWGAVLAGQISEIDGRYWLEPIGHGPIVTALVVLLAGFDLPNALMLPAGALGITLLMIALFKRPPLALLAMSILPMGLAALASYFVTNLWLFRGLIPAQPFLAALALWPILQAWQSRPARAFGLALVLPVLIGGLAFQTQTGLSHEHDSAAAALEVIRAEWQPGDILVHMTDGSAVHLGLKASDLPQVKLRDCAHTPGALTLETRAALGILEINIEDLQRVAGRVWLASGVGVNTPDCMREETAALVGDSQPVYAHPFKDYFVDEIYIVDFGN